MPITTATTPVITPESRIALRDAISRLEALDKDVKENYEKQRQILAQLLADYPVNHPIAIDPPIETEKSIIEVFELVDLFPDGAGVTVEFKPQAVQRYNVKTYQRKTYDNKVKRGTESRELL